MVKKGNQKFTISVNSRIKKDFKKYCEKEGLMPGKQLEKYMQEVLKSYEK